MLRLFAFTSLLRAVMSVLGNLRVLVSIVIFIIIGGFLYLLYQNDFDAGIALHETIFYIKSVWDWFSGMYHSVLNRIDSVIVL